MQPSKPVLHVICSLRESDGGPVRAVLDLCSRAVALGQDCEILTFGEEQEFTRPSNGPRFHILPGSRSRMNPYMYVPALRRWLKDRIPAYSGVVLHGMWLYPLWCAAIQCQTAGVGYVCVPHGMLDLWPIKQQGAIKRMKKTAYWRWFERRIFAGARCIFFTTEREMKRARAFAEIPVPAEIVFIYGAGGSDAEDACPARAEFSGLGSQPYLLFLSRLHPKKNLPLLLRAWKDANVRKPWRLVVAGSGDEAYEEKLRTLVRTLEIDSSVLFVGHVGGADKSFLLRHAQYLALPSLQESFGITVLEAITRGCPVVISNEVYLADYLPRGSEVLPLEPDEWVRFLTERMQDPEHRRKLAAADREQVIPRFEMRKVASDWVAALDRAFAQ